MSVEGRKHRGESEWNADLFRHYFAANDNDTPVTRLVVTTRELALATNSSAESTETIEQQFLEIVRRTPVRLKARFRPGFYDWSSFVRPPDAVLYLLFTCYVASGKEKLIGEGDFRRRMAELLGHHEGTSYPFEELAALWERFRDWLDAGRASGHCYRELVLPSVDWRRRIGYSIGLAFPQRRDQLKLNEIIPDAGFVGEPPLPVLVKLLGRHRRRFSEGFQDVYDSFRRDYLEGKAELADSPLLDAVREAMQHIPGTADARGVRPNLRLIAEPDDSGRLSLLMLCGLGELAPRNRGLVAFETEYGIGDHQSVLAFKSADFEGADSVIAFFLADELHEVLPGFGLQSLRFAARDGVLLFTRGSDGIFEWCPNLDVEGEVRALVREPVSLRFGEAIASKLPPPRDGASVYPDWREFAGIDAALLRSIDWSVSEELRNVRCLQQVVPASRITFVGGVATGEAQTFFGHPIILPMVRVQGNAAEVTMMGASSKTANRLSAMGDGLFRIAVAHGNAPLEGEFIVAARNGSRTLQRKLRFRAFVDSHQYLTPKCPQKWLCESASSDMVTWDRDAIFAGALPGTGGSARSSEPQAILSCVPDYPRLAALIEIFSAIAARRRGLAESEMMELLGRALDIDRAGLTRLVMRGWVEAGYFDETVDISWCARRYIAREPRLVARRDGAEIHGRIVGLSPAVITNQLRKRAEALGGHATQSGSCSPWVPGPWELHGLSFEQLREIGRECGIPEPAWVPDVATLVTPIGRLRPRLTEEPLNYELFKVWSWTRHRFVDPNDSEASSIHIGWHRRPDRLDRPDYYVIRQNGETTFVSYSRNWTLLRAAALARVRPYRYGESGLLTSDAYPWVLLPASIGRFCFAAGGGAAGPAISTDGFVVFSYPVGSDVAARSVLARLGLTTQEPAMPRWLEQLAMARSRNEPLVPVGRGALASLRVPASARPLVLSQLISANRRHA